MDSNVFWEIIKQNAHHIEIINHELGRICSEVEWLTWAIRYFGGGALLLLVTLLITGIYNAISIKKNNNVKHK